MKEHEFDDAQSCFESFRVKESKQISLSQPRKNPMLSFPRWLCRCFPAAADFALATALPNSTKGAFCLTLVLTGTMPRVDTGPPKAPRYEARRERRHALWHMHCHPLTEKIVPLATRWSTTARERHRASQYVGIQIQLDVMHPTPPPPPPPHTTMSVA